jgi:hypothetical protein
MEDQGTGDADDTDNNLAVFAGLVELSRLSKHHPVTLMSKLRPGVVQLPPKDGMTIQSTLILITPTTCLTLILSPLKMGLTQ